MQNNGNHYNGPLLIGQPEVPSNQDIPEQLHDIKEAFTAWVPPVRKLKVGSAFLEAFTRPRVELARVWPAFASWLITDETYGALQWLPEDKTLTDLAREIARLLDAWAAHGLHNQEGLLKLSCDLLPFGEKLTSKDNPAAGCAWQCLFNCANGVAPLALRYGLAANNIGQPGQKDVAVRAAINAYLGKMLDLLKI